MDFGHGAAVPQLRPVLVCRETNPTVWAVFLPLICQHQLPKMTLQSWDLVGFGPSKEASWLIQLRSGFTGKVSVPIPLNPTNCSQLSDTNCPEQDQNLPLQNLLHPLPLQPKGNFPNNHQKIKFRSLSCSSTTPDHTSQTAPTDRWIFS